MALTQMTFDKVWTNPVDFPTYEPNEEQVRADMQYLFDKIKTFYNNHLNNEFTAANMKFSPTPGEVEATNVQAAIEAVHNEVASLVLDELVLPNGSVTTEKLCQTSGEEAVTEDTIRDGAVTTNKIEDGAVTANKLDPNITFDASYLGERSIEGVQLKESAVDTTELHDNAVTRAKILNGEVTNSKLEPGCVTPDKSSGLQKSHVIVGPIEVPVSAWSSSTMKANATVTGVSLTNVATQKVDWTPNTRADLVLMRDNGISVLRVPPANNTVTLECETIPDSALSLYFCIWD